MRSIDYRVYRRRLLERLAVTDFGSHVVASDFSQVIAQRKSRDDRRV
jgi:hypothetical protein